MLIRQIYSSIHQTFLRTLHVSACRRADTYKDSRSKRVGTIPKRDDLEGERGSYDASSSSIELIDENVMDRVFEGMKFKDIPILQIICTRNNTKMCLTQANGTVMVIKSAGTEGFKHCRKGTTVAAQAVANRVLNYAKDHDINMIRLVFNGLGPGRGAAYKVVEAGSLKVISLSDKTEAVEPWIRRPRKAKRI